MIFIKSTRCKTRRRKLAKPVKIWMFRDGDDLELNDTVNYNFMCRDDKYTDADKCGYVPVIIREIPRKKGVVRE